MSEDKGHVNGAIILLNKQNKKICDATTAHTFSNYLQLLQLL